jgi:hypothetical protein
LKYTNLGFNGIETVKKAVDASSMTTLNMDVWSPNITVFNVKLVSFLGDGFAGGNGDSEANINVNLTANQWNKISIPLKDFTDAGLKSLTELNQFIFTSTPFGAGIAYVDNIYFSKPATGINEETSEVNIYPNPVNNGGTLFIGGNVMTIELYNVNGQKVIESNGSSINVNGLPQGLYTVKSFDTNGMVNIHKVIVR